MKPWESQDPGTELGMGFAQPKGGFDHQTLLVGGWALPLNNMIASVGMIIPNIFFFLKNKKGSKPPTRLGFLLTEMMILSLHQATRVLDDT